MYKGEVIKSDSFDPLYKVTFSFVNDSYSITEGIAMFTRQLPYPNVIFDDLTDYNIEKIEMDEETINNIKLHIGNTVFSYLYDILE